MNEDILAITRLMTRRCTNCFVLLEGYNTSRWNWVTPNVGPFCNFCWQEILLHYTKRS